MLPRVRPLAAVLAAVCGVAFATDPVAAQAPPGALPTIAERTAGLDVRDGLLRVHLDRRAGKIWLELPHDSLRVLHFVSQATGLGSNPVGIDRGADGASNVARFERVGDRVLVVFENWNYRSSLATNADHQRTVAEAFPPSTVAALPLVAEQDGRLLADATDFFLRDWMDVGGTLQRAEQGSYAVARDRSWVNAAQTRGFPENTEVDVALTFATSGRAGRIVAQIAPDGGAITLRQHHSFVRLPEGYRPRPFDPRTGFFGITFKDYGQPLQAMLEQRWISRHRLERADPRDPRSPIARPIVYYVDRGIPEPLRTATLEGARFWEAIFAKAGLPGGFRVELLPEGVDPMDARYNVVQWVNRNERGWSIGGSLGDPRTGEILKGMARMDSHRNRTDYLIYAALAGAEPAAADTAFVLARIRQVTAHEIGHTLGMAHSYAASTYGDRASVMDYPAPRVRLDRTGRIDLSAAYAPGGGDFDVWAVRWAYGIFPAASEADSLAAIVREGIAKGYLFLSDQDARPDFGSDPRAVLWDDAGTPEEFLGHQLAVRRAAIAKFGLGNIRDGEPVAMLQERFVALYFFHRFATFGTAKVVGGVEYTNAVKGDGQQATRVVPAARQRAALRQLLGLLAPAELAVPDTVRTLLAPRPYGWNGSVELFGGRTRPVFDELGAARTLASMITDLLLQRDRAARLVQQRLHDPQQLALGEALAALVEATWGARAATARDAALVRVTQRAVADGLVALAADREASPEVRAVATAQLQGLRARASQAATAAAAGSEGRAHAQLVAADIGRWLERGEAPATTRPLVAPPGDPFGLGPDWWW